MIVASKSGVLPIQRLRKLVTQGVISSDPQISPEQFQPNSLDLRLGAKAYRTRCSFLPVNGQMSTLINEHKLYEINLSEGYVFERGNTYIIPLAEQLALPESIYGMTNPKSSAGRLDMLARVITEEGHAFDTIPHGYSGKLYLDLTTRSFPIRLRAGDSLVQIRLLTGSRVVVPDNELKMILDKRGLIRDQEGVPVPAKNLQVEDGVLLTVRLTGTGDETIGYSSKKTTPVVDFARKDHPIRPFWEYIHAGRRNDHLILQPEEFYIFSSRERVCIPSDLCAEMVAFDVKSGEVRTHYAGFFDSGFGVEGAGAHVVLEVRNRDMPFLIQNGQRLFRLRYFRNAGIPDVLYGSTTKSHYQGQGLRLAKQFSKPQLDSESQLELWRGSSDVPSRKRKIKGIV